MSPYVALIGLLVFVLCFITFCVLADRDRKKAEKNRLTPKQLREDIDKLAKFIVGSSDPNDYHGADDV